MIGTEAAHLRRGAGSSHASGHDRGSAVGRVCRVHVEFAYLGRAATDEGVRTVGCRERFLRHRRTQADHAFVRMVPPGMPLGPLKLVQETEPNRAEEVDVTPDLICNDYEAARRSTLEGAGISSMAVHAALLRSGGLQHALAPWLTERFTLLTSFASRHMPARTRVFLYHLIRHVAQARAGVDVTLDRSEP